MDTLEKGKWDYKSDFSITDGDNWKMWELTYIRMWENVSRVQDKAPHLTPQ
jgi:hypothetical protein